jgi:hypothetical protein
MTGRLNLLLHGQRVYGEGSQPVFTHIFSAGDVREGLRQVAVGQLAEPVAVPGRTERSEGSERGRARNDARPKFYGSVLPGLLPRGFICSICRECWTGC